MRISTSILSSDIVKTLDDSIELNTYPALPKFSLHETHTTADIFFRDINMPTWNGFEWLNWIRENCHDFPVVMYSTSKNPLVVRRTYGAGAHLYLNKPMEFLELVSSVRYILQLDWARHPSIRGQHIHRRD